MLYVQIDIKEMEFKIVGDNIHTKRCMNEK